MKNKYTYGKYFNISTEEQNLFLRKNSFIKNIRNELEKLDAIELYMPILQKHREGAPVHQFTTVHPLTKQTFYLRHCMEDHLRRLAYTYSQVFEIGKAFRVEIEDEKRLNEFMVLEYVASNLEYKKGIEQFIKFLKKTLFETYNTLEINNINFNEINILTFNQLVKDVLNFEIYDDDFRKKSSSILKEFNIEIKNNTLDWEIFEELLKYKLEPSIVSPTIIMDFPISLQHVSAVDDLSNIAKRFSLIVNGIEVSDGGEKLKTSIRYREIYKSNAEYRKKNFDIHDNELPNKFFLDVDYFNKNVFTFGLGIDRLFAICEGKTIKDITVFSNE